ncbi:MAG: dTDP-4-amino-4,6-dideoxygalactose transaminase [Chloroflexota bacterium]|nr:dTDP-4-amino-4,6-dideoxygalactose transaminase [Chloroflexota bacterium]
MIPFNKPFIAPKQFEYMQAAVEEFHISGDGPFTKKCHQFLEEALGVKKALLTTNCTHALEMAALILNLEEGDEVIVPSFTFVSTINAFVLRGAKPRFVDIRPDTLNLDENLIEAAVNEHTKAIFVVHYAGVGCEMDAIMDIARRHNLAVVEDNAHGLLGKYKGQMLGTFGSLATQSFHETKNFSCGEGGALIINDPALVERAEIIREKGTNRSRFFRGQIDKYTWVDVGSSYLPSDILAGVLYSHFEEAEFIQNKRKKLWDTYAAQLGAWAMDHSIKLPFIPDYCEQSYHMFYLLMPDLETRQRFIQYLKEHDILAVFHYVPLHTADMGRSFGYQAGDLPVTEEYSDRLVRLPFYNSMTAAEQQQVINTILTFQP